MEKRKNRGTGGKQAKKGETENEENQNGDNLKCLTFELALVVY